MVQPCCMSSQDWADAAFSNGQIHILNGVGTHSSDPEMLQHLGSQRGEEEVYFVCFFVSKK